MNWDASKSSNQEVCYSKENYTKCYSLFKVEMEVGGVCNTHYFSLKLNT